MRFMQQYRRQESGFSLLEISVVLAVISVVLAGVLPFITESTKTRAKEVTEERMNEIENAILSFYSVNGFLPCPADGSVAVNNSNFGLGANFAGGTCFAGGAPNPSFESTNGDISGGMVPTRTLGLADESAFDGWGRRIQYRVSSVSADTAGASAGMILVNDVLDGPRVADATFALISHGENGHGGFLQSGSNKDSNIAAQVDYDDAGPLPADTNRELFNCACGTDGAVIPSTNLSRLVYQNMPVETGASRFDDIVRYKTLPQMQQLVGEGRSYAFSARRKNQSVILNGVQNRMDLLVSGDAGYVAADNLEIDPTGVYNHVADEFIVPENGWYQLNGFVHMATVKILKETRMTIKQINGGNLRLCEAKLEDDEVDADRDIGCSAVGYFNKDDTIAVDLSTGDDDSPNLTDITFSGYKISP